jgi:hypothetical protein
MASKARKARKASGPNSFVAAQNRIRGAANPAAALAEFRRSGSPRQFGQMLRWVRKSRPRGIDLTTGWSPSEIRNIAPRFSFDPTSLDRELIWAAESFAIYANELNEAIRHIRNIEDAVLSGDFQGALEWLESLDRCCGHSLWSIEVRLALLQHHEGLHAQKAYANEIIESANPVVAVVTHYTSQRNEEQMPLFRFEAMLNRALAARKDDGETYLRYKLLHEVSVGSMSYSTILNAESQVSILDYYEAFVALAQRAALQPCPFELREAIAQCLESVDRFLEDPRLRRSLFVLGAGAEWLEGAWEESQDTGRPSASGHLDDIEAWRLVSEDLALGELASSTTSSLGAFATQAIAALKSLADFPDLSDEVAGSQRLAANLRGLQLGRALKYALDEQYASTTSQLRECRAGAAMHSRRVWPTHLLGCGSLDQLDALIGALRTSHQPGLVRAALLELGVPHSEQASDGLDNLRAELADILTGASEAQPVELFAEPPTGVERARSRVALRFWCTALLERGEADELVRLLAHHAVIRRNVGILPIVETVALIDRPTTRRLAGDLALPIVFDLYFKYCSQDLEEDRTFASEDALAARGVATPHELANEVSSDDKDLLTYYLRYLAVPEVMESFTVFESTQDLEEERVRVLSILISIDSANADAYEAEAKDITRAQAIRRGMRQVEQSKIYVDVVRIRKILERELRDDFVRYMSLPHMPINESRDNLIEALRSLRSGPASSALPEIPKDESSALLVQMMATAFGELTSNKEHGLDCYLSMRIRHGALSGQLRTPMERQRLITQVSADGVTYEPNSTWLDSLSSSGSSTSSAEGRDRLRLRMNELSAAYDQVVDRVAKDYVQVRTGEKPGGWFDIAVRQIHVIELLASIGSDTSFEDFVELLISQFFTELKARLSHVRSEIERSVKPALLEPISAFELDLAGLADVSIQPALRGALATARVDVQQALDVVKDWFQLPQIEEYHTFEMEELIHIGLQCVKVLHVDYHPVLSTEIGEVTPILDPLVVFTDIFVILFENARVHSGSKSPEIQVTINQVEDTYILRVENSVIGDVDEGRMRKIRDIRNRIESGSYVESVAKEGGSGLIKLQRIASSLDESSRIQFGLEADRFWTTVPIRGRFV